MNERNDISLFKRVMDSDEIILWNDRPHFVAYMLRALPFILFGGLWAMFDSSEMVVTMQLDGFWYSDYFTLLFQYGFLIAALVRTFVRAISYRNVYYAFTDRQVIITNGFLSVGYELYEYTRLYNIQVDESPIERMLGVGTIRFPAAQHGRVRVTHNGRPQYAQLVGIEQPFETFRSLKLIEDEVKHSEGMPNIDLPGMKELFEMSPDILRKFKDHMEE